MHFSQLEYIIEISRQPTLNAASEQLHITPQALSLSVKNLEKEMNVPLLDRSFRGIKLTPEGEKTVAFAIETLQRYQELRDSFSPSTSIPPWKLSGDLTIYANNVFFEALLSTKITEFKKMYPHITIYSYIAEDKEIVTFLQDHYYEEENHLGVLLLPCSPSEQIALDFLPSHSLHLQPFSKNSYYALIPKNSPLAKYKCISIKTLLSQPIVFYRFRNSNVITPILYLLQQHGDPNISMVTSSLPTFLDAIADGLGIGFLNNLHFSESTSLREKLDSISICKIKEPFHTISCFATTSHTSEITQQFLKLFTFL